MVFGRVSVQVLLAIGFIMSVKSIVLNRVRAISFDVTGTVLVHKYPIFETYADAAVWAKLKDPPSAIELKPAFKAAYKQALIDDPCFGSQTGTERVWWAKAVKLALANTGRTYNEEDFERFFRRVYSHYGSLDGYEKLSDAVPFLNFVKSQNNRYLMGVCSNSPSRTLETVLPMLGLHEYFKFFVCSQDVGAEKPSEKIFQATYDRARFWMPDLKKEEVLHIGDSMPADFCGARRFGFQSLLLDRSKNPRVTVYQDWLEAPDYPGKSDRDILSGTVPDLLAIMALLESAKNR